LIDLSICVIDAILVGVDCDGLYDLIDLSISFIDIILVVLTVMVSMT